jgi:hypothetical protein
MADPDYYLGPEADVFEPVAALLKTAHGTPSYFLEQSTNRPPTHYEWQPLGGAFSPATMVGKAPRELATCEWRCLILCRAASVKGGPSSHDLAWRMAQRLASACRRLFVASFSLNSWSVPESSQQPATLKTDLILDVSFKLPFLEQRLETEGVEPVTLTAVDFDKTAPPYGTDDGTLRPPLG